MSKILEEISRQLFETAIEPDRSTAKDIVDYLVPDDAFVFLKQQPANASSPAEESPSLATLRRNMNQNKEIDK